MRRIVVPLLALVAALLSPAIALADCSADGGVPRREVVIADPPTHYDFTQKQAMLAKVAREHGTRMGKAEAPLGLTVGKYDLKFTLDTDTARSGAGYCAHLRSATVDIGLSRLDVLVDHRYPAGSCQYAAILDHENQHVEIFREAIRHYETAIDRALAGADLPAAVYVGARDHARAAYLATLDAALTPLYEAIRGRARDGNARIDTPENYARVLKSCPSW